MKSLSALATGWVLFCFFEEICGCISKTCSFTRATGDFRFTIRIFAHKFALGFRAFGFSTFPIASGVFTDSFAFGFGGLDFTYLTWQ
jgi:hypothetical protein